MELLDRYEAWVTKVFYPNITLGTIAYVGLPFVAGHVLGARKLGAVASLLLGLQVYLRQGSSLPPPETQAPPAG